MAGDVDRGRVSSGFLREADMRYMLLIYKEERWWDALSPGDQDTLVQRAVDYSEARRDSGFYQGGDRLEATTTATTVRVRDGKPLITDGPFAETKEQLAGYTILEARNLDEVLDFVTRHPLARGGLSIEIRPMREWPPTS
jgi:hypothetical protein